MCETWTLTRLKDHVAPTEVSGAPHRSRQQERRREGSPQMSGAADAAPAGVWPSARLACGKHTWDEAGTRRLAGWGGVSRWVGWAVWAG